MIALIKFIPWLLIGVTMWESYGIYENYNTEKSSLTELLQILKNKITRSEKKKTEIEQYYKNIDTAKSNIKQINKELILVKKKLPDRIDDAETLSYLKKITQSVMIRDPKFQQAGEQNKDFYIEKKYSCNAQGTFLQFISFFKEIVRSERLFNIKEFRLSKLEKSRPRRFQIINGEILIETYKNKDAI